MAFSSFWLCYADRFFRSGALAEVILMSNLLFAIATLALGFDERADFVEKMLAKPIINSETGLNEVRAFCEAKVPKMPEVKDLASWQALADRMRRDTLDKVVYRGEAKKWRDLPTKVEWQEIIAGGPGYRIKKLRYEIVPGFWVPALLYEPENLKGRVPAVLNFDGHDPKGMFADYKQVRCINLAKRGIIALNVDWIGMGQLKNEENQHTLLNHLDLCGTSGLAVFYSLQTRGVDVLLTLENVDPTRIAATGLSGGGWQTIFLGAMDPRVALTVPVAGYSSFLTRAHFPTDLGDSEQTPVDLATVTDYALMTAMLAPRGALLTFNAKDNCCFASDHALIPLLDAASPIYRLYDQQTKLRTHINHDPGTHNYLKDNRQALYKVIGDQFFEGRADYSADEIPADDEVKTPEQLKVVLPPDQATLHSLAMGLSKGLPRGPKLPGEKDAAIVWQAGQRVQLEKIVHSRTYGRKALPFDLPEGKNTDESADFEGLRASRSTELIGETWTIPSVQFARSSNNGLTIVIADKGKKQAKAEVLELLDKNQRVIAIDLLDTGESTISDKAWLWNLYVSTVGDRPIGLKASQLKSLARLKFQEWKQPVSILAIGPDSSLVALIAAGLEPEAIGDLELREAPGSLKEVIESNLTFDKAPDRFCFGLLEAFDVPQLVALVAPRKVVFKNPSARAQEELVPLKGWYKTFGVDFDPVH